MLELPAMADPLSITANLSLDPAEIEISYIRASGPGGQNVNKVSSAAQLRFDLRRSPSLPDAVAVRAAKLAGSRLTLDGDCATARTAARCRDSPKAAAGHQADARQQDQAA